LTAVGDVEDYAVDLEQEIAAIGEPVVVVAHSFGGLIARYALERLGAAEVTQLVTLGTPHQGTYKAVIASFSEGGRQMLPGSRFLNELNAGSLRTDVGYTAVWSDADDTIVKPWRARFPDALVDRHQDARNVMVEGFEHFGLLWSRHVLDVYLDRLAT
jgi:triacylglycerol lipase